MTAEYGRFTNIIIFMIKIRSIKFYVPCMSLIALSYIYNVLIV